MDEITEVKVKNFKIELKPEKSMKLSINKIICKKGTHK